VSPVWPVCPRPQPEESLLSWFERIGREYDLSAAKLLASVGRGRAPVPKSNARSQLQHLHEQRFREELAVMARLPEPHEGALTQRLNGWELETFASRVYCPHCLLQDLKLNRPAYGRQVWQQAWYTLCAPHGTALRVRHGCPSILHRDWSRTQLVEDADLVAANQYRTLKVAREPELRCALLGCLLEIERAVGAAISGVAPNPLLWGRLSAEDFLLVLRDVTTWSLTHFEPVRAWCAAEDLTIVEEQEGYGMVGRIRRLTPSDYPEKRTVRALQDVVNPKVRGAALWVAHAMMSVIHPDASDRPTGVSPQERQATRLRRCVPEGRRWLADRQRHWPRTYLRSSWICVAVHEPSAKMSPSVHRQE